MTAAEVKLGRERFSDFDNIGITIDENYHFHSSDTFLIWDDTNEVVTCVGLNERTAETMDPRRRGVVTMVPYSSIVSIEGVPDLSKIDSWISKIGPATADQIKAIKNSFKRITDDKQFL